MISKDKQYRTVEGGEAVLNEFHNGTWYGRCYREPVGWIACSWDENGKCGAHLLSVKEVKPRIKSEYWVNVYPDRIGMGHEDKNSCRIYRAPDRIACVKIVIDCEEGEGL